MNKHDPDNKACPQNDAQFCHFNDLVLCACKPVDRASFNVPARLRRSARNEMPADNEKESS